MRLIYGDAIEELRGLPAASCSALVTDPPYTSAGGSSNGRSGGNVADGSFFRFWLTSAAREIMRVMRPDGAGFVFCDWRSAPDVVAAFQPTGTRVTEETWRVSQMLVWDRESIGMGTPFRNGFEMIAFVRGPEYRSELPRDLSTVIRHRWPYGSHEWHGAEKPRALVARLVSWCPPGAVIDPFAGSATTLLAAMDMERECVAIERDMSTYNAAERRIRGARVACDFDARARSARLDRGLCPDCGSDVEWRMNSGTSTIARCMWSGHAYLTDAQGREFDAGRRCNWAGTIERRDGGTALLDNRGPAAPVGLFA